MSANASNSSATIMTWSFTPISELVLMPFSLLFNGLVIVAFFLNNHLRTPFNFYLANLVLANFIYTLIEIPLDIINGLYSSWWMGAAICDLYLYLTNVFIGVIVNTHLLITLNRIWVVAFPHSYIQRHTVKTAVICCLAVWVYVHAACLPGLFINASNRLPLETAGCILNYEVLFQWNIFVEFCLFGMPQTLITVAYPYLLYKRRKQRRRKHTRRKQLRGRQVMEAKNNIALQETMVVHRNTRHRHPENKRAFGILTVSTVSTTLTWTPGIVYYGMSCFLDVSNLSVYYLITTFLFLVQTLMDPVLFLLVLSDLRTAVLQIFKKNVTLLGKGV